MRHVVMFTLPDGRPQYSRAASYDAACRDAWSYACLDCVREVEVMDEGEARERMIAVDRLLPGDQS